jgi:molybdopterin-containing oxidoreductase family iron-sulfur binding subunit
MSHDQCHSTTKGEDRKPGREELLATPRQLTRIAGRPAWRSLDEVIDTPEFREHLEREFPAGMAELVTRERIDLSDAADDAGRESARDGESRRDFLKLMGASMALAGAATIPGCRRPDHTIYTYSKQVPEDIVPGKPLFYVTSMARFDGGAEGLLVETHEGRPTKIEGNPLHPHNQGKGSTWAQASIMQLYDPDRLMFPMYANPARGRVPASWDDFRAWGQGHFAAYDATQGEKLAFLVEKSTSPTRAAMRDRVLKRWPKATWVAYSASASTGESEGTRLAFGKPMRAVLTLSPAKTSVIVSLDRDFLMQDPGELVAARGFASTRACILPDDPMSRLYVVEGTLSATGAAADHRLRVGPSRVTAVAVELARQLLPKLPAEDAKGLVAALEGVTIPKGDDIDEVFVRECAADLLDAANRAKSAVVAGASQPAIVHALCAAMNAALSNIGNSVAYLPVDEEWASDGHAALASIASDARAGKITTLVCIGANPVYDAPGDVDFAGAFAKIPATISLSVGQSETAIGSTWALNAAHWLESWGDARALDGTLSPTQPMIAPLYEPSLSEVEFLALLASKDFKAKVDGYELVREVWRANAQAWWGGGATDFESRWKRALHDGVVPSTAMASAQGKVNFGAIAKEAGTLKVGAAPTQDALEVVFGVGRVADGRFANVGWLQELPQFGTTVVWDNPALVSPKTAMALGLLPQGFSKRDANAIYTKPKYPTARMAELQVHGRIVVVPVWILPGMADNVVACTLGYGRTACGLIGDGVGVNVYPLRNAGDRAMAAVGATLTQTPGEHMIASTQNHWTIDAKDTVVRVVDRPAWQKHGAETQKVADTFYGTDWTINFAERLGELSHTPPNLSIYKNPYNGGKGDADPSVRTPDDAAQNKYARNQPPAFTERPQWGMTIDQGTCTGCGACTLACQAENNIPVVGKKETAKGRELAWIRVDRYFTGDGSDMDAFNNPSAIHHQPVACVHCENAPCEVVCPVNATIHGPEGLNYMTYNRCIGTRYCANNCPYKVRRYNWFDYGVTKFNGGYFFKEVIDDAMPDRGGITGSGTHNRINPNLIPPRLRQKLDEVSKMQKNPDVTVRSRGVMEKCTYCIQRINAAKIECKLQNIKDADGNLIVPEGFFQTACQQACPSNAIVFGDILDKASKVYATRNHARSYALLGYLNTRPRTSHMMRVMNPNPKILAVRDPKRLEHIDNPFHHGPAMDHGHDPAQDAHDHGGAGQGAPGHDSPAHGADKPHSFHFDRTKRRDDGGYAMSLRVLMGGRA